MLAAYSESATATRPRSLGSQLQPTVSAKHVKAAIKDCDYMPTRQISLWHVVFAVMLVSIGILIWQLIIARNTQSSPISSPISSATQTVNPDLMLTESAEVANNVNSPAPTPETGLTQATPEAEPAVPAQTAIQTQTPAVASPSVEPGNLSQPLDGALLPGIVSSRIDAYQRLIETGVPGIYTIRVLTAGTDEIPFLARSLNLIDRSGLLDSTYVCLTQSEVRPIWLILFGQYNKVDDARAAINDLPPELWPNHPFAQNVETVQCSTVRS
jgi:septal ring-binding cell division protein DamX